jgi:hypothetical protein
LAPLVPEDYELAPGELSTIDRTSPAAPEDAYRCPGCTKAECQVCRGMYVLERPVKFRNQLASCMAANTVLGQPGGGSSWWHIVVWTHTQRGMESAAHKVQLHALYPPLHSAAMRPDTALFGLVPLV